MTFDYASMFNKRIADLKEEGRYRVFANLERAVGTFPEVFWRDGNNGRAVTVWCSNDYLGMGHHPKVLAAMKEAIDTYGAGAGGTRNISGTHHPIIELEYELADLHDKEAALVFTSGYVANETALSTLGNILPSCIIFSDQDNHASMIQGIRHCNAEKKIFKHNDPADLHRLLSEADPDRPKIIAFESVYSMDGDFSPIDEFCALARKFNALTYLDETHAVGLYGKRGGGVAQEIGACDKVDIIQGGLGKGYGVVGGFITANAQIIDTVRSYGAGFIFTTTLPPVVAAGAVASIRHLKESTTERELHQAAATRLKEKFRAARLPMLETTSHIIPLMVRDSFICKQISDYLLESESIYIQPINYPTVPRGTERLRITPGPYHTEDHMEALVQSLLRAWGTFEVKLAA